MEVVRLLGIAAASWLGAFSLVGALGMGGHSPALRAARVLRLLYRLLGQMARTQPVRWLLRLPSWREASDEVVTVLGRHGIVLEREEGCAFLLAAALLLVGVLHSPLGLVAVVAVLAGGIPAWHEGRCRARAKELSREMPEVFRTLALALGSGQTLAQAIGYVGTHAQGPAGKAFSRCSLRLGCGATVAEAIEALRGELDTPGVGLLATALVVSQRTGSPLKGLFDYAAELLESRGESERLLAVKTAQVRLSVRIVTLMPPVLVGTLALLSADFRAGLMTMPGMVSLGLATAMDLCAILIVRRLLAGVLS